MPRCALPLYGLVVILAGPVVSVPVSGARVVFVADRSESISSDDRLAETAFIRNALARMHPNDRAAVVDRVKSTSSGTASRPASMPMSELASQAESQEASEGVSTIAARAPSE